MYKVLITTTFCSTVGSAVSVHTVVVEFNNHHDALGVVHAINADGHDARPGLETHATPLF